jgi:hypothetical protein
MIGRGADWSGVEWNAEKDLFFQRWNVEKYFLDGVECGEIPVEH